MKKLLCPCCPWRSWPPPARPSAADFPNKGQAHHHRRAVLGRRPHGQGRPRPGRGPAQAAQRRHGDRRQRRRRRGSIGANKVAKSPADGHTLLLHHISMATMPTLVRNIPFSVENDFEYLGLINDVPMTIIGKPSLPANNWKELVSWIQANKGKINLGNAGVGSASHLCGMLFQHAMGVDMTAVPYKGTGPAMTDLMGGQIDLMCDQTTNTTSQIEGKKVKAFAVTSPKRLSTPALKDIPTMQELGQKDFMVSIFHGLYAPKGTPPDVQKKLNDALKTALKDPEFIKKQEGLGAVVVADKRMEPAEHKKFVASEIAKWSPIIKAAGVYVD
jgi:tripartite-type tricarboxylate transporter receptor subunit TctC